MPVLRDAIADLVALRGRRVLDFGCGEGRLTLALADRGAPAAIEGIDRSGTLIERARSLRAHDAAVTFRRGDETDLPLGEPVDVAVCSLMLMMCRTRPQLGVTVGGLIGSVVAAGQVVVAITHPCFRRADHGEFRNALPERFDYWQAGRTYDVQLTPEDSDAVAAVPDTHWTLSDYLNAIADSGGVVERALELPLTRDDAGRPVGPPAYLVLRCARRAG